ncbi:MAG TPA: hypothetical protein VM286_07700 [Candidatus Thermoplasmatota archaeon]|nr:hypothetical protein [Candidatus Thermoplasmatota archaeon]
MPAIKRKRVTQVGSGAYSIYLPKRWIDGWSPEQQARREVDLHQINQSLLIVPAIRADHLELQTATDPATVCAILHSAYVRGHHDVTLTPRGGRYGDDCVAAAREFLRRLDERLRSTVAGDRITFTLQRELPPPFTSGTDLLQFMATRLREVIELASECVESSADQPDRALHAARLLVAIHAEDLSRLFAQALRLVATLELPLGRISDFQLLDLAADEYHTAGTACVQVADTVLAGYGLEPGALAYPRADLLKRIGRPKPAGELARAILQGYRASFQAALRILAEIGPALQSHDVAVFLRLQREARAAQEQQLRELLAAARAHWGKEDRSPGADFTAHQLSQPISSLLGCLGRLAQTGLTLSGAQPEAPA